MNTPITVNGKPTTAEEYCDDHGWTAGHYGELIADLSFHGCWDAPNGDEVLGIEGSE